MFTEAFQLIGHLCQANPLESQSQKMDFASGVVIKNWRFNNERSVRRVCDVGVQRSLIKLKWVGNVIYDLICSLSLRITNTLERIRAAACKKERRRGKKHESVLWFDAARLRAPINDKKHTPKQKQQQINCVDTWHDVTYFDIWYSLRATK